MTVIPINGVKYSQLCRGTPSSTPMMSTITTARYIACVYDARSDARCDRGNVTGWEVQLT